VKVDIKYPFLNVFFKFYLLPKRLHIAISLKHSSNRCLKANAALGASEGDFESVGN